MGCRGSVRSGGVGLRNILGWFGSLRFPPAIDGPPASNGRLERRGRIPGLITGATKPVPKFWKKGGGAGASGTGTADPSWSGGFRLVLGRPPEEYGTVSLPRLLVACRAMIAPAPGGGGGGPLLDDAATSTSPRLARWRSIWSSDDPVDCICRIAFPRFAPCCCSAASCALCLWSLCACPAANSWSNAGSVPVLCGTVGRRSA